MPVELHCLSGSAAGIPSIRCMLPSLAGAYNMGLWQVFRLAIPHTFSQPRAAMAFTSVMRWRITFYGMTKAHAAHFERHTATGLCGILTRLPF